MINRRKLLLNILGCSVAISPGLALARAAWKKSLSSNSDSNSNSNSNLKNYVQFNLAEAPSRWLFDLILRPNSSAPFVNHPYIVDRYDGNRFFYEPSFQHGFGLPLIWNLPFTDSRGKMRTAAELLPYWGNVRGVRMLRDGHGFNNRRLVAPQVGGVSITGQIADRSASPLASVGWLKRAGGDPMAPLAYRSEKGASNMLIPAGVGNPFDFIFNGIEGGSIGDASDRLLDSIETEIRKEQPHIPNYKEKRADAKKLLQISMADGKSDFIKIYKRYQELERQITLSRPPLLTQKRIPGFNLELLKNAKSQREIDEIISHYCFVGDAVLINHDLVDSIGSSYFKDLPYQFALVEFFLKNKLSESMVMCMGSIENVVVESIDKKHLNYSNNFDLAKIQKSKQANGSGWFDSHTIGTVPNFLHTSLFFQVFSASLLVLIDHLKENKLFDSTLLHVASEFDREPNESCDGSDHGTDGNTSSFFSGKIKGPFILGDILKSSAKSESNQKSYATWGHGAPMAEIDQGFLTYENISSTVSYCLGLSSLTPNKVPLLKFQDGLIVPSISIGKNVNNV